MCLQCLYQELVQEDIKSDVELVEEAKIYGKTGKALTKYQKEVNKAAIGLAKENPLVVLNKGEYQLLPREPMCNIIQPLKKLIMYIFLSNRCCFETNT